MLKLLVGSQTSPLSSFQADLQNSVRYLLIMDESAGSMYALTSVLGILAIIAIMLRSYARRRTQTAISWDDHAILLALVSRFLIINNI